jgi:competence protein ComEC
VWWILLGGVAWAAMRLVRRRHGLARRPLRYLPAGVCAALLLAGTVALGPSTSATAPAARFVLSVLDVGQGDAILMRPAGAPPILVDTGPPGAGAADRLRELGVGHLGALVITHDQSDHAGALAEILREVESDRLVIGPGRRPAPCREIDCPPLIRVAAGAAMRSGRLRLRVLWPPRGRVTDDPNATALVLVASFGRFDALLTGDAESELAAFDPPDVELLKLAHHGSADAGLDRLLADSSPRAAVISVGDPNPYGHPAPATLAELAESGVAVYRTDEDGEVEIRVAGNRWTVE